MSRSSYILRSRKIGPGEPYVRVMRLQERSTRTPAILGGIRQEGFLSIIISLDSNKTIVFIEKSFLP